MAANDQHFLRRQTMSQGGRDLRDIQTCVDNLNRVSENGEVTAQQFLDFLALQSGGLVAFSTFQDVPLDLRLLFYATACSGGQDCTKETPKISLSTEGIASSLLQIFCTQVEKIVEQPPDSLKVSFRYNLYYNNDLTPEDILSRANGNTIVSRLETATERVVSIALGCSVDSARRRESEIRVHALDQEESNDIQQMLTEKEQRYCHRETDHSSRQLQGCDYTVKAVVEDLIPYGKCEMQ